MTRPRSRPGRVVVGVVAQSAAFSARAPGGVAMLTSAEQAPAKVLAPTRLKERPMPHGFKPQPESAHPPGPADECRYCGRRCHVPVTRMMPDRVRHAYD